MKFATAAATALLALLLLAPAAGAASPTGFWKLYITIDFSSEGTATNDHCFPDPEQVKPSPLTATASESATVRTTRAATVEAHEAPNGVAVFAEETYSPAFRGDVKVTRKTGLGGGGEPLGCAGGRPEPKPACGTKAKRSGLYVSPMGGIHDWKGFVVEMQETPLESFDYCQVTEAQNVMPDPFRLEIKAPPRKLLGHSPKLVFRGNKALAAIGRDGNTDSTATGKLSYTVKLVRTNPY